jgi:predicted metal-dependent phosphoesterase TrpH/glycosyltransferase involved in cell wall biosynthesis
MTLKLCLVCPYTLTGSHPVAEHVRGVATSLAANGELVTVLAPSSSSHALRAGRRRLRALANGDTDAVTALDGEPLVVAVAPAVPLRQRGRRRGAGLPVAASANVALAVREGQFDIVHAHDPLRPGVATAALKHSPGLTAATFHATVEPALTYPVRPASRERYLARIDALLATSPEAAELASEFYPGDYTLIPAGVFERFRPGPKPGTHVVAEWTPESRPVVKALVRMVAATPNVTLTLLWVRRARRPIRPYIPPAARGRVHTAGPEGADDRAAVLAGADVFVAAPDAHPPLTWEALASGCAVVAAHSGIEDLVLGYGFDQPPLAAAAVARLLEDDELRGSLGRRGSDRAATHRFDRVAATLEERYRELRAHRRPARPQAPPPTEILADLHMHTNHSHDCATQVDELIDHCIAQGLGAIAITDHNEVSGALEAVELVKAEGKPITVIVGEEVKTSQGEVIGMFLTERIDRGMSMADTIAAIQEQNGLVYMPHPFDRMHTIPDPATLLRSLDQIDIFEVYNSRLLFESFNEDALRFASKYNLVQAAGSDAHVLPGIGTAINRIPSFNGSEEFLMAMRHNRIERRPKSLLYLQGLKWAHQMGSR